MTFALDELEARAFVDPARGDKDVVRPEDQLAVSRRAREADAFIDEA